MFKRYSVLALVVAMAGSLGLMGCPEVGVLEDGLLIVDDVPGLNLADLGEDTAVFVDQAGTAMQAGDIIVGTDQGGYLRQVESVNQSADGLVLETSPASLNQVVRNGWLVKGFEFTTEDFINAGLINADGSATLIDLSGRDIYRDNGIAISVANGTIECVPEVHMAATWENWSLSSFRLHTGGTAKLDLDIKVGVDNATPLHFETDLVPPIVHPFATAIGPIPVVGRASLRFPVGVIAQFDGDVSATAGFDVVDTFAVGASYEFGSWDRTFDVGQPVLTGHEPVWVVEVGANVKVYVKVLAEVSLYEAADLSGYLMPYMNANMAMYPSPATFVLTGGLDGGFAYGLEIFDFRLLGDSYHWNGPSTTLYTWSAVY